MSRYINTETAGKDRTRLTRSLILALRELMRQTEANDLTRDLAAYITLALEDIAKTIDESVGAWEKKGYWVKADRFRLEWEWSQWLGQKMHQAVLADDWGTVALTSAQVAQRLNKVTVPVRNKIGTPWVGAWNLLKSNHGKE